MLGIWICIRIRKFLGLPDPDPLVRGGRIRIPILPYSHNDVERTKIMLAKKFIYKILAKN
jgi:hypothetical protein